jgi:hypothetical protein
MQNSQQLSLQFIKLTCDWFTNSSIESYPSPTADLNEVTTAFHYNPIYSAGI